MNHILIKNCKMITNTKYYLTINKYYRLIEKRYSKLIFLVIDLSFAFFTGILTYYSLKFFEQNRTEIAAGCFLGLIGMVLITEILQINIRNSFQSTLTLQKIDIYPLSKLEQLKIRFISSLFSFRILYYLLPLILLLVFQTKLFNLFTVLLLLIFSLIYLSSTIIFTLFDFGFAKLIQRFGKKANMVIPFIYLVFIVIYNLASVLNVKINFDMIINKTISVIYFLLNK